MSGRVFGASLFFVVTLGAWSKLPAAAVTGQPGIVLPYDVVDPSAAQAKRFQQKGDYVTAVLINEAILARDPSDQEALHRMIECQKAVEKKERAQTEEPPKKPSPGNDEGLSELPNLVPTDTDKAQKPPEELHKPLL